ncbi:response regulator transcription factor [Cytophagaceae bacterium DM2B3-1]|uniref:Response regulator transcription factor n=1 Tax=Xanthocytophaga flava TaxID=3048013 RepID=A0ABT7CS50_9BACT|nr:response regulator transcription factor [Xanthocytophaga flavus]MDJ1470501.1 response regulator transcription factor [Xanthocytophaga flavus]MDJ1496341.1 response regulator transcription factor [Xanthocytophaga flavus]
MQKTKVLYVEDEPFLGKIVKESLESRSFDVCMVADGQLVSRLFEEYKPDICVLDIMLPNKDGYEVATSIRQKNPQIPILFLTAKTQTEDLLKGFQAGGNDYIKKPFSMEELIVRMQNLLQITYRKSQVSSQTISIGRYEFNPQRYELKLGDKLRKLSYRETELLSILAENQNFTVNRKEILLRVWDDDSFFNSRNLDVYITKLRDYLKEDTSVQIITIKGVGYNFLVGR